MSEADFLREQARTASLAMGRVLQEFRVGVGHGIDPRTWTRDHPWIMLGSAAASGFTAASLFVPRRGGGLIADAGKLGKSLWDHLGSFKHDQASSANEDRAASDNDDAKSKNKHSITHLLFTELLHAIRPIVLSVITSALSSRMHGAAPSEDGAAEGDADTSDSAASAAASAATGAGYGTPSAT